jgi:hypothetical protein
MMMFAKLVEYMMFALTASSSNINSGLWRMKLAHLSVKQFRRIAHMAHGKAVSSNP